MDEILKKPVYRTILYYIIAVILITFFNLSGDYRSGPCNPGMDVMSFVILFFVTIILLVRNAYLVIRKKRQYLPSLLIHCCIVIVVLIFLMIDR
jgi:uncharacterized membrane protein